MNNCNCIQLKLSGFLSFQTFTHCKKIVGGWLKIDSASDMARLWFLWSLPMQKKKDSKGFFGSNEYLRLTLWLTRSLKGQFVVWLLTWQFFKISIRGWRSTRKKSHVSGMGVPQWNMSTCLNIQKSNKWACVSLYLVAMPISDFKMKWPIHHNFNWEICVKIVHKELEILTQIINKTVKFKCRPGFGAIL